ncbi:MAG: hypothetical protein CFE23_05445 [Flavobacterium sp. BFFFF1]|uniref:DUF3667 domain-containing protein n=1 Tax=Flavobacterium sp. BFFFF1 TaxID=2015557 RepID=UPI000BC37ECD|nr:DUF3667 domain-containing protein [Flavobacterium sp. BFFFF1]OYU81211.1 MAG: hypothetical protein CFE23_05445 [Flavobacterium sp. BFFFF1]
MTGSHCLNCNATVHSRFCPDCGQKSDTHRIVLKHFVMHDLLHGVWHIERGILFTIKEALVRPGQAAMDYISGKRIRYYNVFYLCLLLIGFTVLLSHFYESFETTHATKSNAQSEHIKNFFKDNLKFIVLSIVPMLAICGYLIFRRLKLNLAEHFIIAGIALLGKIFITMVGISINFADRWLPDFMGYVEAVFPFLILLWPVWVYTNASKGRYRFGGLLWRFIVFYLLFLFLMLVALIAVLFVLTGGEDINFK